MARRGSQSADVAKRIKVVAVRRGYYGSLREPGDKFTVATEQDIGSWMAKAEDKPEAQAKGDDA